MRQNRYNLDINSSVAGRPSQRAIPASGTPLLCPSDTAGLLVLIDSLDGMPEQPQTVIWLNDLQRFLFGEPGERAAAALSYCLAIRPGTIAVGTVWQDYWHELTRRDRPHNPAAASRALLESPHVRRINVSDHFDTAQQDALRRQVHDPRMKAALDAGGARGLCCAKTLRVA